MNYKIFIIYKLFIRNVIITILKNKYLYSRNQMNINLINNLNKLNLYYLSINIQAYNCLCKDYKVL